MLTLIPHIEIYFTFAFLDCARYNEYFAKSRFFVSRFCSIHFMVILAGLKKIVIPRTSLYRGSLNRGSTVFMKYKNITKLPQTWMNSYSSKTCEICFALLANCRSERSNNLYRSKTCKYFEMWFTPLSSVVQKVLGRSLLIGRRKQWHFILSIVLVLAVSTSQRQ